MTFNSLTFLMVLLPISIIGYVIIELCSKKSKVFSRLKNIFLVLVSVVFFSWSNMSHIKVLFILVVINYAIGLMKNVNKNLLLGGVGINIFILIYFKYTSLIFDTFNRITKGNSNSLEILAPLGISFIVFHCISYMMDLYNKQVEPCYNIIDFALYITFFPKLVQGPIVKYKDMEKQIRNRILTMDGFVLGVERFIVGMMKKVLIADVLSKTVNDIYDLLPIGMDVGTAWLGTFLFTLQIYFDFSGYSDMAIGLSKMFGFDFKENFDFPYRSKSITEFWRRWHISLGAWFREYLYFPLGGNRKGNVYINLFVVFLVTGIWHGAAWIYLLWGAAHGACVVFERYVSKKSAYIKIPDVIKWVATIFIVNVGWICFKVSSVREFVQYIKNMLGIVRYSELTFTYRYFLTNRTVFLVIMCCLGIAVLGNVVFLMVIGILCFVTIVSSTYSPFLYFQY